MEDIYILIDPLTQECRYVGKAKDSHKRFIRHLWEAKKPGFKKHLYCWIRSVLNNGLVPIQIIIDTVEDWKFWERFYIDYFKSIGCNLTNLCDGGQGSLGYKLTDEQKSKISIANKGNKPWNTGLELSEDHRKAISIGNTGKKFSEESKLKIGLANQKALQNKSKFSIEEIKLIKYSETSNPILAKMFDVKRSYISSIKTNRIWRNV